MSQIAADDADYGGGPADVARANASPSQFPADASPRADTRIANERTISPVAGRFAGGKAGKAVALLGLLAGAGVFLAATWSRPHAHKGDHRADEPVKQVVDFASVRAAPPKVASEVVVAAPAPDGGSVGAAAPSLAQPGAGAPSLTPNGQVVPALSFGADAGAGAAPAPPAAGAKSGAEARALAEHQAAAGRLAKLQAIRAAPLLVFSTEVRGTGASAPMPDAARSPEGSATELDQLRHGSTIGLVHALRLPDRNFLITAGALLPCVLETALDTSAPGFVTCRIPRDVYSDNGAVILMEKGSHVLGEYRSGFQQGRARIFVLWDRITTPGGVAIDVGSPAADALGRAGFDGRIDSHFWQRFGGALLLTSLNSGISAAATADARIANVAQAPNEAAASALQNSINVPPTLTKAQGAEVAIFVSRDLDFASVYALKGR